VAAAVCVPPFRVGYSPSSDPSNICPYPTERIGSARRSDASDIGGYSTDRILVQIRLVEDSYISDASNIPENPIGAVNTGPS